MSELPLLHVSLGPVQSFVAEARRTRDVWAGSFLLSWLAGHGMKATREFQGKIELPDVINDPLWRRLTGETTDLVWIGSLPNRFQVRTAAPIEVANAVTAAIQAAWQTVAAAVWKEYVAPVVELGHDTAAIWQRQVDNFWEIQWAVGEPETAPLAARKRWRNHGGTIEGGDHCTMMGQWQEISGHVRAGGGSGRQAQQAFYDALQKQVRGLDLRDDERLCAIALIKRLYPRIARQTIGWDLDVANWPSTSYLAALPWMAAVAKANPQGAEAFAELVDRSFADGCFGETRTRLPIHDGLSARRFLSLDGNAVQPHALANDRLTRQRQGVSRREVLQAHADLCRGVGQRPSPYYALLLMDGDKVGRLLGDLGPAAVTAALGRFTQQVPAVVTRHNGVTVYAGGDDVLAMLPMPDAIACATELAAAYAEAFAASGSTQATISAGLVFAHHQTPFRTVISDAHRLLDRVAKDGNGRASLAVAAMKGSGLHCQWVQPWQAIGRGDDTVIHRLVTAFRGEETGRKQFANRFFYAIRRQFSLLGATDDWRPGQMHDLADGVDAAALLTAEYLRSRADLFDGTTEEERRQEAGKRINDLLAVCREIKADGQSRQGERLGVDGALLVRFLARDGEE